MSSSPAAPATTHDADAAQATVAQNVEWFQDNDAYMSMQSGLPFYKLARRIVERELRGAQTVLDVGNGGFFNYDTGIVRHVTALDLFLKDGPGPGANTSFKGGSILAMPFADAAFDCVLLQNVFHHITGRSVAENFENLRQSMRELFRCTQPGGKAVIVESTVGGWFNAFETAVYRLALAVKRGGHPVTYQFTANQILRAGEAAGFEVEEWGYIPTGTFVLQFGHKWPAALTPVKPIKLILRRPGAAAVN